MATPTLAQASHVNDEQDSRQLTAYRHFVGSKYEFAHGREWNRNETGS